MEGISIWQLLIPVAITIIGVAVFLISRKK